MNAVSLVRPNGFADMRVKSVTKKLKNSSFAADVPRDDINKGARLIDVDLNDHIAFLIEVFKEEAQPQ
jgi:predicted hydrolase (HD superfamily)